MKKYSFLLLMVISFSLFSCVSDSINSENEPEEINNNEDDNPISDDEPSDDSSAIENLKIPDGFDFETQKEITITINDSSSGVIYDVYAYNDEIYEGEEITIVNDEGIEDSYIDFQTDVLNHFLFSSASLNIITQKLSIPTYYDKIYIRRKDGFTYTSEVVDIVNNTANYTYSSSGKGITSKSGVTDFLYCVNGSAELFQVDPLNGDYTFISDMPMGSYTAAIDQENNYLYSIGKSNPNPLMRYDIANETWTTISDLGKGGPRLDYNSNDGLLYFSSGAKLYTIDPVNGAFISTWEIEGLHNTSGGDLAFAEDGTIYLCSFSGLYSLALDNNNVYQATRISAENLPFDPTSMTFDSDGFLWLANNGSNSNLIIMDTVTGGWEYYYGVDADNGTDFGRTINDLTTFRVFDETPDVTDTDGDGIVDADDEYPEDAEKAFETYTPSKYGWGTIAFEDLWPFTGDYDFNDMAVNYRFTTIQNSSNEVVELQIDFEVTSDGAGFTNGFGIEFENLIPSQIESVSGTVYHRSYITNSGNGTEANQDNAVIVLYDDNERMLNLPTQIIISFTDPLTTEELGTAPFNPFMIINMEREKEIHLPNRNPTTLGDNTITVEDGINKDTDGNYETDSGLPWAIDIVHDFKVPVERTPVNEAYNFFNDWATSGGSMYEDWYKDNPGYRNESKLQD